MSLILPLYISWIASAETVTIRLIISESLKNGVTLISVLEHMDDSPESIILESVLEGMSEYYFKNLAREVMKGMKESALPDIAVSTGIFDRLV